MGFIPVIEVVKDEIVKVLSYLSFKYFKLLSRKKLS